MTLEAILHTVKISEVFRSLGGEIRGNRGKAFYRNGTKWSLQFDDRQNFFKDHAADVAGGVLKLVQLCLDCSRAEAISYLEHYVGAPLGPRQQFRDLPAAREWRDAMIADQQAMLETWDRLKIENERRYCGETRFRKWKELCEQQAEFRLEIERLRALKGRELVEAYQESRQVLAIGA